VGLNRLPFLISVIPPRNWPRARRCRPGSCRRACCSRAIRRTAVRRRRRWRRRPRPSSPTHNRLTCARSKSSSVAPVRDLRRETTPARQRAAAGYGRQGVTRVRSVSLEDRQASSVGIDPRHNENVSKNHSRCAIACIINTAGNRCSGTPLQCVRFADTIPMSAARARTCADQRQLAPRFAVSWVAVAASELMKAAGIRQAGGRPYRRSTVANVSAKLLTPRRGRTLAHWGPIGLRRARMADGHGFRCGLAFLLTAPERVHGNGSTGSRIREEHRSTRGKR